MMNIRNARNDEPKIRIIGTTGVSIDPVATVADLVAISGKFAKLVVADKTGAALRLSTATGDLIASVQSQGDTREEFAEEVADVVIGAFVIASLHGLDADDINQALRRRLTEETSDAVQSSVAKMLAERGMDGFRLQ